MNLLVDKRINRFVQGFLLGENEDVISLRLTDINESFHFDSEVVAQDFLNKQAIERVADKELRNGYFDYEDETGLVHRYLINGVTRGEITSFDEEIIGG